MIDTIKSWTADIPAKPSRTRFGNESFGIWYDRLKEVIILYRETFQCINI